MVALEYLSDGEQLAACASSIYPSVDSRIVISNPVTAFSFPSSQMNLIFSEFVIVPKIVAFHQIHIAKSMFRFGYCYYW